MKHLRNSWKTLKISLINCEVNLILVWSAKCLLSNSRNQETTLTQTDTNLYAPVRALSTRNNAKLLQQSKSGFKRTINWNKYQKQQ